MNDKLPEPQNAPQGPNAQDPSRRRILRAAASAAPLIATLPSGVALANSSAFQCIGKDKTASDALTDAPSPGGDYVVDPRLDTDRWLRAAANRVVWTHDADPTNNPAKTTYRFSADVDLGPWYLEDDGSQFIPEYYPGYTKGSSVPVSVLKLYVPTPDHTNPTSVVQACTNPGTAGAPTNECFFPFAKRQDSLGGHQGLNESCANSFT